MPLHVLSGFDDFRSVLVPSGMISLLRAILDEHISNCAGNCPNTPNTRKSIVEGKTSAKENSLVAFKLARAVDSICCFIIGNNGVGVAGGNLEQCIRYSLCHHAGLNFLHLILNIKNDPD